MTHEEIIETVSSDKYGFLRNHRKLKDHLCIVTLGGSYAYGTNIETSDLDIRGVYMDSYMDLCCRGKSREQFVDEKTDTTIYSFTKIISLLSSCNPNTIEILGCRNQDYLYTNEIGKSLIKIIICFCLKDVYIHLVDT